MASAHIAVHLLPPIGHANNSPTPPGSLEKASGKKKKVPVEGGGFSENLFYVACKVPLPRFSAILMR